MAKWENVWKHKARIKFYTEKKINLRIGKCRLYFQFCILMFIKSHIVLKKKRLSSSGHHHVKTTVHCTHTHIPEGNKPIRSCIYNTLNTSCKPTTAVRIDK